MTQLWPSWLHFELMPPKAMSMQVGPPPVVPLVATTELALLDVTPVFALVVLVSPPAPSGTQMTFPPHATRTIAPMTKADGAT